MKFVISTQELNYLINKCQNVVPTKPAMPILNNFLIEAKNNEITITATDLTVGIRCSTEAKVWEEGTTTLPAKRFSSLIKELTAANVEISTDANHQTEIVAGSSKFRIPGMDTLGYPSLPPLENAHQFATTQKALREQLFRTSFAVSREDSRFALTGIHMYISKGTASFVGTDGKRLARSSMPIDIHVEYTGSYIIPIKTVEELVKSLNEEGEVTVYLMKDKVAFQANQMLVITQLLAGEYPDVDRIIPQSPEVSVALHREELTSLLRQVSLFAKDDAQTQMVNSVRFTLKEGELKLSTNTADVGEGKVSMPANYHGPQLDIAFNPFFFLDILRHCRSETVLFGATDPFNPGVLTESTETQIQASGSASPLFVLMPMRLSEV